MLSAENALLEELIHLGTAKREGDQQRTQVARIAEQEQEALVRLAETDQRRAELFDVLAMGKGLEQWLLGLDGEQRAVVEPLLLKLAQNLGELQALNDLNQQLLAQALSYVQYSLNLITGRKRRPLIPNREALLRADQFFDPEGVSHEDDF